MTRLRLAQRIANARQRWKAVIEAIPNGAYGRLYLREEAASLALDGYSVPRTRRKLPACTPVFKPGMPF